MATLSIEDVIRIIRINGLDSNRRGDLAFTITRPNLDSNKNEMELWIRWRDGSETYWTSGTDSMPKWSPSGVKLAFASRRGAKQDEKGVGVYVASRSGEPRRLAWFRHGVWRLRWLGDSRLLVGSSVPSSEYYDSDGDYVATDRLPLWFNGQGYVGGLRRQIFLLDEYSGHTRQLTDEAYDIVSFEACDNRIIYATIEDWRTPTLHRLVEQTLDGEKKVLASHLSVGEILCAGNEIFVTAHRHEIGISSHYKLYRVTDEGLECVSCDVLDRNIWVAKPGPDSSIYTIVADRGRTPVYRWARGEPETVFVGDHVVRDLAPYDDGLYTLLSAPTSAPDIYNVKNGRAERVTRFNKWIEEYELLRPEHLEIEYKGDKVEGWVLAPKDRSGKLPLILYVHGGPKGMYGYGFYPEKQLFAAKGFIVAYANPRGSDGYSEEFADIRGRYGRDDYEQLMAFLDKVIERYPVDTKRMVVTGISYGGYMTNVIVTKTDRFAAAVSENGIADWIADYWASDIGYWFNPDQIGGTPLDSLENYIRNSPVFMADMVRTPMLIIHSAEDYRCFADQALAMHTALTTLGKDSTLVMFTKGDHSHSITAPPRHRKKRLEIILKWIKKKLNLSG